MNKTTAGIVTGGMRLVYASSRFSLTLICLPSSIQSHRLGKEQVYNVEPCTTICHGCHSGFGFWIKMNSPRPHHNVEQCSTIFSRGAVAHPDHYVGPPLMPSSDNNPGYQSTGSRTNMEKTMDKLQKPLVMTRLTSLEERVDELPKARRPLCLKAEIPTTSDLFGPFDHVEDCDVVGKVSSESDIICVQGYSIKQSVVPILKSIFKKHGDIAADCLFKPASMRSSFLEIVCEAVSRVQTNDDIPTIRDERISTQNWHAQSNCSDLVFYHEYDLNLKALMMPE